MRVAAWRKSGASWNAIDFYTRWHGEGLNSRTLCGIKVPARADTMREDWEPRSFMAEWQSCEVCKRIARREFTDAQGRD